MYGSYKKVYRHMGGGVVDIHSFLVWRSTKSSNRWQIDSKTRKRSLLFSWLRQLGK